MSAHESEASVAVVIAAAGSGSRMGHTTPKQYLLLDHQPVLIRAIQPFLDDARISRIVIVHDHDDTRVAGLTFPTRKPIEPVVGGSTRAESVLRGLAHLLESAVTEPWVMVHDAARPLVTVEAIDRLLQLLANQSECGGLLAIPVTDTIKESASGLVARTPDRANLWAAQTPQLFPTVKLHEAIRAAAARGLTITDESSAMELAGERPVLVMGDQDNFKITHPDDLDRAEMILAERHARMKAQLPESH